MLIVPCAYMTRLNLNNTLKGGLKLHYFICTKFWLVLYRFNMHKTKAFGLYACTLRDHMLLFSVHLDTYFIFSTNISNKIHLILITLLTCMLN